MIVVVGVAVEVGNGAQHKKDSPADVERPEILNGLANQQQNDVGYYGHNQPCCRHKLIGVHFARVVYFRKFHKLVPEFGALLLSQTFFQHRWCHKFQINCKDNSSVQLLL